MKREIILLSVISLIILGGILYEKSQSPFDVKIETILSYGGIETGDNATDFILEAVNGTDIRLDRFIGQKAVIAHFWSLKFSDELNHLQTVRNFYGDKVEILGIYENMNVSLSTKFAIESGINFPLLFDKTGEVKRAYAVSLLPSTYFIDKFGVIAGKKEGPMTEQELNEKAKVLIK